MIYHKTSSYVSYIFLFFPLSYILFNHISIIHLIWFDLIDYSHHHHHNNISFISFHLIWLMNDSFYLIDWLIDISHTHIDIDRYKHTHTLFLLFLYGWMDGWMWMNESMSLWCVCVCGWIFAWLWMHVSISLSIYNIAIDWHGCFWSFIWYPHTHINPSIHLPFHIHTHHVEEEEGSLFDFTHIWYVFISLSLFHWQSNPIQSNPSLFPHIYQIK